MVDSNVYEFLVFFMLFSACICFSNGLQFNVGGKNGWRLNPSEDYNRWAESLRFQVNDTLFFKYKKGSDSVLVVNKDDYNSCNTTNPIEKFDGGRSIFRFDRSGPFFFISGNEASCIRGQKLIVVVLAVRSGGPGPSPVEPPAPRPGIPPVESLSPAPAPAELSPENSTPAVHPPRRSFAAAEEWGFSAALVGTVSLVLNVWLGV
ncbi:early nodulin-like protein 3 [Striga hermonthica]|uniref:Early nodulin-like protein 3 n=1 Tax=Striga hermonthica TaxID=68872 RepID=A0A9N7R5H1_STRHE|nr:early nodulin-like protein 3 [Striga hermonthica]